MNFEFTKATDIIFKSKVNPLTGGPFSKRYYDILKDRKKLPVLDFLDTLEEALEKTQVLIVEGETVLERLRKFLRFDKLNGIICRL